MFVHSFAYTPLTLISTVMAAGCFTEPEANTRVMEGDTINIVWFNPSDYGTMSLGHYGVQRQDPDIVLILDQVPSTKTSYE